ncbi:helix-turn-helix transcriptional regulator [Gemmata palustris]|uniref:helix-turn-helix transcriptional regulator n=1 Tax=Gemmata palustris TaxID=2822762 RepID=UPI0028F43C8F|nr:helix-turn-helix transcriptional regulator [Gemmata palustris]
MATGPTFGERLKELREAAALSQYALAKKSGVSKQAISLLEKGESEPAWVTVRKLARALGISVSDFDVGNLPGEADNDDADPPKPAPKKKPPKK